MTDNKQIDASLDQEQMRPLSQMRRVLQEAASRLAIEEGSIQHEELAGRVLQFFESGQDSGQEFVAAARQDAFEPLDREDERALVQLGAAMVLLWDRLAPAVREEALRTAATLAGIEIIPDAQLRLQRMIEDHAGRRRAR